MKRRIVVNLRLSAMGDVVTLLPFVSKIDLGILNLGIGSRDDRIPC